MFEVYDSEAAGGLGGDGEELGVDAAVVVLEHVAAHRHPLVALLLLSCLAIDVPELTVMHHFLQPH